MVSETYYQKKKPEFKIRYEKVKIEKKTHASHKNYYENYYKLWCKQGITETELKTQLKDFTQQYSK